MESIASQLVGYCEAVSRSFVQRAPRIADAGRAEVSRPDSDDLRSCSNWNGISECAAVGEADFR
jgi:hypothetical protein